jgi:hypothetical protein
MNTYHFQTSDGLFTCQLHPSHFGFLQNYTDDGNPMELFDITQKDADEGIKLYQQYLLIKRIVEQAINDSEMTQLTESIELCKNFNLNNKFLNWLELKPTEDEISLINAVHKNWLVDTVNDYVIEHYLSNTLNINNVCKLGHICTLKWLCTKHIQPTYVCPTRREWVTALVEALVNDHFNIVNWIISHTLINLMDVPNDPDVLPGFLPKQIHAIGQFLNIIKTKQLSFDALKWVFVNTSIRQFNIVETVVFDYFLKSNKTLIDIVEEIKWVFSHLTGQLKIRIMNELINRLIQPRYKIIVTDEQVYEWFQLDSDPTIWEDFMCVTKICHGGYVRLLEHTNIKLTAIDFANGMVTCATNGQLDKVKQFYSLLTQQTTTSTDIVRNFNLQTFQEVYNVAASNGHLDIIQWIASIEPKIILNGRPKLALKHSLLDWHIFGMVCHRGFLEVAKWIHANCNKTIVYNYKETDPFVLACHGGQLEIAQWIIQTKPIPSDMLNSEIQIAARQSCQHLHVLQWLNSIVPLKYCKLLNKAVYECDNLESIKWLYYQSLKVEDTRIVDIILKVGLNSSNNSLVDWIKTLGNH